METRRTGWLRSRRFRSGFLALAVLAAIGGRMFRPHTVTIDTGIGRPVTDFTLADTSGRPVSLHAYQGKAAVVLVFMGIECPVGNLYMPRLVELSQAYRDKGVVFLILNSNAHETREQVAEHARSYHVEFPVLKDPGNLVADRFRVERTCATLVLDGRGRLCYRGAIDDQYGQGKRKSTARRSYLVEALDAVLARREVAVPSTPVVGCPIDRAGAIAVVGNRPRVRPAAPEILAAFEERDEPIRVDRVTYSADVAPILQAKCQSCHRAGQVGPFSLLTYEQACRWAGSIREVVADRRMPPWHADPRYGRFINDRGLTARQRHAARLGRAGDAPGQPEGHARRQDLHRGLESRRTPDLVVPMREPFAVPAQGVVKYQHFRVPTGFTEDRWIQAAEARPGDRAIVHHIGVYVDDHDPKSSAAEPHVKHVVALYFPGENSPVFPPASPGESRPGPT